MLLFLSSGVANGRYRAKDSGDKVHTWLSRAEVLALMNSITGGSHRAWRDRTGLALLVGEGLRREEAVSLTFAEVPISEQLVGILEAWRSRCGNDRILRAVRKGDKIGETLSDVGLFNIVRQTVSTFGRTVESRIARMCYNCDVTILDNLSQIVRSSPQRGIGVAS